MKYLIFATLCMLLLSFIKGAIGKLHPIISIIFFFLFFAQIFALVLYPLFSELVTITQVIPYSKLLAYTALLLLLSHLVKSILEEQEYDAFSQGVDIAIRGSLVLIWLQQLKPAMTQLTDLLHRFS
ncbi:pyruvate formate-lyase [Lysinibacillus sp. KU-BSD001]|uniref:pyruvate formate-lyase n=1 Tax=Lysinibacillus sp. KU-BSD001 TaxID=3141328 RepID=UPI0036E88363